MRMVIIEVLITFALSVFTAMVIQIHNFGVDLEKGKKRPTVIYVSEALMSSLCGSVLALCISNINENFTVWIIAAIIGSYMGKRSLYLILKLFLSILRLTKEIDIEELNDSDGNKKE